MSNDTNNNSTGKKRSYVKQTDIPRFALDDTLAVARTLVNEFAGKPTKPQRLATALNLAPASSKFRELCSASVAYGLTEGAAYGSSVSLTTLGKNLISPGKSGEDIEAKIQAVLNPRVMRDFFEKYDGYKFPSEKTALGVLSELGIPAERAEDVLKIIRQNGECAGILLQTKSGPYVELEAFKSTDAEQDNQVEDLEEEELPGEAFEGLEVQKSADAISRPKTPITSERQKVFISHGKNRKIVEQLKDLLVFGKFDPVVAIEHETTSKPVPIKVLDDMARCFAGIIHIESEEELLDREGNPRHKLNENVLIEIGVALALFRENVILLVEKGIQLPTNLQGLYLCYYEGEKLDYDATMKLLKTFNEFH